MKKDESEAKPSCKESRTRINVDAENKTVIVTKFYRGKKLKAVVRCKDEDVFDESFGIELAKRKLEIKKEYSKLLYHDKEIRKNVSIINASMKTIKQHDEVSVSLADKVEILVNEYGNFVKTKYNI